MGTISNAAYIAAGKALLAQAAAQKIPYVLGGMSLTGMDCQGLAEYLLIACGVPQSECKLAGSNAHWRQSLKWHGTPEEAVKQFGCVPGGALLFIVNTDDAGAPAKYRGDGMGNASHMGLYLDESMAVHASASRGCVAESVFRGKTIPNGGWNRVGLCKWVEYGTEWEKGVREGGHENEDVREGVTTVLVQWFAVVDTPNGAPVKMRARASKKERLYWSLPCGVRVRVLSEEAIWFKVAYGGRTGYVMREFLRLEEGMEA